jgi:hypothetical protein
MASGLYFGMQGLGDHISSNGLIRTLIRKHKLDEIYVLVWTHYSNQVAYMFRDDPRIQICSIDNGAEHAQARTFVESIKPTHLFWIGHTVTERYPIHDLVNGNMLFVQRSFEQLRADYHDKEYDCHQLYYAAVDVPFKHRFDDFYIGRNLSEEERIFNKLNPNHEEYIFVHDDAARGFKMPDNVLQHFAGSSVKVIRNDVTENLLDFSLVVQNAKQVHTMESSFRCFVETVPTEETSFFLHHYIRRTEPFVYNNRIAPGATKKHWTLLHD